MCISIGSLILQEEKKTHTSVLCEEMVIVNFVLRFPGFVSGFNSMYLGEM